MVIVCFSSVCWDELLQRQQQIMSRLSKKGHIIIYIEPTNIIELIKKKSFDGKRIKKVNEIIIIKPVFFPLHYLFKTIENIDRIRLKKLLNFVLSRQGIKKIDIVWCFAPYFWFAINTIRFKMLVYDCADESEGFVSSFHAKKWIIKEEEKLIKASDLIFATTDALIERCRRHNQNVIIAPNGVPELFFKNNRKHPLVYKVPRPIIGYIGAIADWLDYELLYERVLINNGTSFVFVGPITTEKRFVEKLMNQPNVYYLGSIPHDEISSMISSFNVGLVPFKINSFTDASFPIKVLEYFSQGIPVIATKLKSLMFMKDLLYFFDDIQAIDNALNENNIFLRLQRIKLAKEYTWENVVNKIEKELQKRLN